MPTEFEFKGKIEEDILVPKKDIKQVALIIRYINKIRNIKIRADKWADEGKVWIHIKTDKTFSKEEAKNYIQNRKGEDHYCYVGTSTKPIFEIHFSKNKDFVLINSEKQVSEFNDFEEALNEIKNFIKEDKIIVNVSSYVSNLSAMAVKYGFDA